MKRAYAAKRLLEHGALPFCDFVVITGWSKSVACKVLARLIDDGVVTFFNTGNVGSRRTRRHARNYALASLSDGVAQAMADQWGNQ